VFSIVKLLNNYRSHPAIIHYPSERFYDGELEACGDPSSINSCLNLGPLVRNKYPVIFCGVEGRDLREAFSPSFFNIEEVLQVKAFVQQLLADTRAEPRIGKFFLSQSKDRFSTVTKRLRRLVSSRHTARNARSFARH
jgi:superfamily I DNA and/or RNA helicase